MKKKKKASQKTKKSSVTMRKLQKDTPPISFKKSTLPWEEQKKRWYFLVGGIVFGVFLINTLLIMTVMQVKKTPVVEKPVEKYWFMLHRKSNKEYFYRGVPGDMSQSRLLKVFTVKTGIPGERPTPLPNLVGQKYWLVIDKFDTSDNVETAPYFLTLNVPAPSEEPYGPSPYTECNGQQCSWVLPGAFGLHGVASDSSRLTEENPGSSGCIRHTDADITYLYHLLDPKKEEIRYYIEDK